MGESSGPAGLQGVAARSLPPPGRFPTITTAITLAEVSWTRRMPVDQFISELMPF